MAAPAACSSAAGGDDVRRGASRACGGRAHGRGTGLRGGAHLRGWPVQRDARPAAGAVWSPCGPGVQCGPEAGSQAGSQEHGPGLLAPPLKEHPARWRCGRKVSKGHRTRRTVRRGLPGALACPRVRGALCSLPSQRPEWALRPRGSGRCTVVRMVHRGRWAAGAWLDSGPRCCCVCWCPQLPGERTESGSLPDLDLPFADARSAGESALPSRRTGGSFPCQDSTLGMIKEILARSQEPFACGGYSPPWPTLCFPIGLPPRLLREVSVDQEVLWLWSLTGRSGYWSTMAWQGWGICRRRGGCRRSQAVSRSKGDLPREHLGVSGRYPLPRSSPPRPNTYLCPSPIISKSAGVQIAPSDLLPSHP